MAIFSPNLTLIKITVVLKYYVNIKTQFTCLKTKDTELIFTSLETAWLCAGEGFYCSCWWDFLALVTETAHFFQYQ